ncbi:MAG: hypothetical protein KBS35_00410 [Mycoplasma sp.]|nr:hypothetical protein [Candidatus Hennigella equi]
MKKNHKILLSTLAGMATVSAVCVPALSSCSKTGKHANEDWMDKKYGVDEITYQNMRKDLDRAYRNKLKQDGITDPEVVNARLNTFSNQMQFFDTYSVKGNTNINYTALTTGLKNFANRAYNLHIKRVTRASWSDLDTMFNGFKQSFGLYMQHVDIDPYLQTQILADATSRFTQLKAKLEAQGYRENDPLGAIEVARTKLFQLFDSTNAEIAKLAGIEKLNEFLHQYSFEYIQAKPGKPYYYSDNRLNVLMQDPNFRPGADISSYMGRIFNIHNNETGTVDNVFDPFHMVPEYVIIPILKSINQDQYSNARSISIDWTAVKADIYKNKPQLIKEATAHLYKMSKDVVSNTIDESKPISEILDDMQPVITDYDAYVEPAAEDADIQSVYFDKNKAENITFKWNVTEDYDTSKCAYEPFFDGIGIGEKTGEIHMSSLAKAGLLMSEDGGQNYKTIQEFIDSAGAKKEQGSESGYTLGEKFVTYMDVQSNVEIVSNPVLKKNGANEGKNVVKNKLFVTYNETFNKPWQACRYDIPENFDCHDFPITKEFFYNSSLAFKTAKGFIKTYIDHGFDEMKLTSGIILGAKCLDEATQLSYLATFIYQLWTPLNPSKGRSAIGLAVTLAGLALGGATIAIYTKHHFKPLLHWEDQCDKLSKSKYGDKFAKQFAADEQLYVDIDDDGKYDQKEFDSKYIKFEKIDFELARTKLAYYQFFAETDDCKEFLKDVERLEILPEKFDPTFNKFDPGGEYFITDILMDVGLLVLNIIETTLLAKSDAEIKAEREHQKNIQKAKAGDKVAADKVKEVTKRRLQKSQASYVRGDRFPLSEYDHLKLSRFDYIQEYLATHADDFASLGEDGWEIFRWLRQLLAE